MKKDNKDTDTTLKRVEDIVSQILIISENSLYQENYDLDLINKTLEKRGKLFEELMQYEDKVKFIINLPEDKNIEQKINDIKNKIKKIEEIDKEVIKFLKEKKEKTIKEISKITDIKSRRYNSLTSIGIKPKFFDIKQR
ncbi:MAG: hypothetical protein H0Z29_03100 [Candidatus Marinimicrobia bacterium]|nr:hypothetical protein [Candidatus Neomarinimicrobiota bacterium]